MTLVASCSLSCSPSGPLLCVQALSLSFVWQPGFICFLTGTQSPNPPRGASSPQEGQPMTGFQYQKILDSSNQVPGQGSSLCPINCGREWWAVLTPTQEKKKKKKRAIGSEGVRRDSSQRKGCRLGRYSHTYGFK